MNEIQRIKDTAEQFGAEVRSYSGRFMYGKECIAVDLDRFETNDFIAKAGVPGARTDSLGMGSIVYWPSIAYNEDEE